MNRHLPREQDLGTPEEEPLRVWNGSGSPVASRGSFVTY